MGETLESKVKYLKTEGTFSFSQVYNEGEKPIQVLLIINYVHKTFTIAPPNNKKEFRFINLPSNNSRAKAVMECMIRAVEFANNQLSITNTSND